MVAASLAISALSASDSYRICTVSSILPEAGLALRSAFFFLSLVILAFWLPIFPSYFLLMSVRRLISLSDDARALLANYWTSESAPLVSPVLGVDIIVALTGLDASSFS